VYFFIFGAVSQSGSSYSSGRTSPEKALQKLKHFCGYQERSHAEARQKLYSLGLFKNEVEELIGRLIEEEYLNEERFARLFASGKSRIRGWGKQKIRFELRQKGVSAFCITRALNGLDEKEYQTGFERTALKKWTALRGEKNIFARKNKWYQFLLQRGYEPGLIKSWTFPEETETGTSAE
jgi:regulatory protein